MEPLSDVPQKLKLFVAGENEVCRAAVRNLKLIVAEYLPKSSSIEIIDILENPEAAESHSILAIPMLLRTEPPPERRIVGDLVNLQRVLICLGFSRARLKSCLEGTTH